MFCWTWLASGDSGITVELRRAGALAPSQGLVGRHARGNAPGGPTTADRRSGCFRACLLSTWIGGWPSYLQRTACVVCLCLLDAFPRAIPGDPLRRRLSANLLQTSFLLVLRRLSLFFFYCFEAQCELSVSVFTCWHSFSFDG